MPTDVRAMRTIDWFKVTCSAILLALPSTVGITRAVETTLSAEQWKTAYGFPAAWHVSGVTSLSRQVDLSGFFFDWMIYSLAVFALNLCMLRITARSRRPKAITLVLFTSAGICLIGMLLPAPQFINVDVVQSLDLLTRLDDTSRMHVGFSF